LKDVLTTAQNTENLNLHTSKIGYLLPVYGFQNTRHRFDHISDPRVKFGKIHHELRTQSFHNALIETKFRICTSLKSYFYFRFHSPLNTKAALLNFICIRIWCWSVEKCGH